MKLRINLLFVIILTTLFSVGCQKSATPVASNTPLPTDTLILPTPSPTISLVSTSIIKPTEGPRVISTKKLECASLGNFKKCIDETLNMEFEHPTTWGEIEAELRTGWDSGYIYKYSFSKGTASENNLPDTGGVSIDFAEGREWYPTDFAGFGDKSFQVNSCENNDLYPICNEINSDVRWMIRFPNALYFCEYTHQDTSPIFRIEVNLPNSPTVNGFVFVSPFLSENLSEEIEKDIYSLFLVGPEMMPSYPEGCYPENRKPFDEQVVKFIERLRTNSLDVETQKNLDNLIHFAKSITLKQ